MMLREMINDDKQETLIGFPLISRTKCSPGKVYFWKQPRTVPSAKWSLLKLRACRHLNRNLFLNETDTKQVFYPTALYIRVITLVVPPAGNQLTEENSNWNFSFLFGTQNYRRSKSRIEREPNKTAADVPLSFPGVRNLLLMGD